MSVLICAILFFALGFAGGFRTSIGILKVSGFLSYYGRTFGTALLASLEQFALLLFLFLVALAVPSFIKRFISSVRGGGSGPSSVMESPMVGIKRAAKKIGSMLLDLLPVALFMIFSSFVFSEANALNRGRLQDLGILNLEHGILGSYLFVSFGAVHIPSAIIGFIITCFLGVAGIVIIPALFVGYATPRVLRELIVAFCIGMLILIPIWLLVPAMSPQDRFIDNVYSLPVPPEIAAAVATYHPQEEIAQFLKDVRVGKSQLPDMPTSTIPSAHMFWLGVACYYFFRSKKWLGWVTLPFLTASAMGTIFLAQHYFLDIIASIGVIALAVFLEKKITGRASRDYAPAS